MFGIVGGAGVGFMQGKKRSRKFGRVLDRLILKMPIIGPIMHKAAVARYARTLATMFAAGVPLVEALESVAGATGNVVYSDAVLMMRDSVATGQQLTFAMSQTGLFPNMVVKTSSAHTLCTQYLQAQWRSPLATIFIGLSLSWFPAQLFLFPIVLGNFKGSRIHVPRGTT